MNRDAERMTGLISKKDIQTVFYLLLVIKYSSHWTCVLNMTNGCLVCVENERFGECVEDKRKVCENGAQTETLSRPTFGYLFSHTTFMFRAAFSPVGTLLCFLDILMYRFSALCIVLFSFSFDVCTYLQHFSLFGFIFDISFNLFAWLFHTCFS